MMLIRKLLFVFGFVLSCQTIAAERITWDKKPISLRLQVGQEREIVFPGNIQIGIQQSKRGRFSTLSSVDNRLFIESAVEFEHQKLLAKDLDTGVNYVLILSSVSSGQGVDLDPEVIISSPALLFSAGAEQVKNQVTGTANTHRPYSYHELTRYVAQQLYAPERLLKKLPGVQRVSIPTVSFKPFRCDFQFRFCGSLIAKPVLSFKANDMYVSAIQLRNTSDLPVDIDVRFLEPIVASDLLTATPAFSSRLLGSQYKLRSTTILIITHRRPLDETFRGLL